MLQILQIERNTVDHNIGGGYFDSNQRISRGEIQDNANFN